VSWRTLHPSGELLGEVIDEVRGDLRRTFDLPKVNIGRVMSQAAKKAGPPPPKGDMAKHWAWHERHQRALYELCKKGYDEGAKTMAAELERLDVIWKR
jgi:hypothetical protein